MEKEKFVKNRFVSNTRVLILSTSHLSKYQVVLEIASTLYGVEETCFAKCICTRWSKNQ